MKLKKPLNKKTKVIPLNTLTTSYILNEDGVPCHVHSSDKTIATQPVTARFSNYTCADDYKSAGVKYIVPMTAKEIESKEEQEKLLSDEDYYVEEKFDGTRGIMHFFKVPVLSDLQKLYPDWRTNDLHYLYCCLIKGSGFVDGKRRIYDYFVTHKDNRAEFLKNEYGTGGTCSGEISFDTSPKGFVIRSTSEEKRTFTWSEVAKSIQYLIDNKLYYAQEAYTRVFSRRESKKTGWLTENTDSVPQLRDLNIPELDGTIIDGEMFIPNQPFKAVSSTLNCKYDKAIVRQLELGGVVFHAFDILFYKGIDLRKMPLERRKVYLKLVCDKVHSIFVQNVPYFDKEVYVPKLTEEKYEELVHFADLYPNLSKEYGSLKSKENVITISKAAYYEYIVLNGGEGVIIKPKNGRYYSKRGREYQKIKKFLTRECIICGFTEPTEEYTGKFPTPEGWQYWESNEGDMFDTSNDTELEQVRKRIDECAPITRYRYNGWVGNIIYGVIVSDDEYKRMENNKKYTLTQLNLPTGEEYNVLIVGECGGFDDSMRQFFTDRQHELVGQVVEIKANEIFRDTGKMRHPRYLRLRPDKDACQCTFKDHIQ